MTSSLAAAAAAAGSRFLTDFSIKTIIEDQSSDNIGTPGAHQQEQQHQQSSANRRADEIPTPIGTHETQTASSATSRKYRPKNFWCPTCKMPFSNNGQLKNHVRIHTGERPFRCNQPHCNKTFTRNEELTRHKLIHTGVRPHSCGDCGKRFGRKDHLKKHVRTHDRKKLRKKVFVPAGAYMDHDIDMFVPPKPARLIDSQDDNDDDNDSDRPQDDDVGDTRLIDLTPPSSSNNNDPSALTATHHMPLPMTMLPTATSVASAQTPGLSIDHLLHCQPHHQQLYHHAITSTLATSLTSSPAAATTTTNTIVTPSAIQQLASDYWSKWYNLLGLYQHQYHQPPIDSRLGGLFREG